MSDNWISVEDSNRCPEENQEVLVRIRESDRENNLEYESTRYKGDEHGWMTFFDNENFAREVTHWQPIEPPEAPHDD